MPALPLLYSYRRCPYAMRARMALLHVGIAFQVHEVVLRDKPAELLRLSPKGTVPVLRLPDGPVIDESWDVMAWALSSPDPEGVWQRAQSAELLALRELNDGPFKRLLDRYKYPGRHTDDTRSREAVRDEAVATLLTPLERRLQPHAQLGGDTPCATDFALFPFVRQFAAVDPAWFAAQPLPALQAWLQAWLDSPLFAVCMTKLPANTVVDFPAAR